MVLRETMIFTSSLDVFLAMFKINGQPSLCGEDLLVATPEMLQEDYEYRAKANGNSWWKPGDAMLWKNVIPGGEIPRIYSAEYNYRVQLQAKGLLPPIFGRPIWDIHQNVQGTVRADGMFPTLMPNAELWSSLLNRPAVADEHLLCQGIVLAQPFGRMTRAKYT